jgi:hypothetical protein
MQEIAQLSVWQSVDSSVLRFEIGKPRGSETMGADELEASQEYLQVVLIPFDSEMADKVITIFDELNGLL